jgi:FdhD protein
MSNLQHVIVPQFDEGEQQGVCSALGVRYRSVQHQTVEDWVMDEHPVALVYNGLSHVVMMVTPTELENFAVGFSLSEGIIADRHELYDIEIMPNNLGTEIKMTISARAFALLKSKKRAMTGRTGCGLCGIESLQQLEIETPQISHRYQQHWLQLIPAALKQLPTRQPMTLATGGAHAAAWLTLDGQLLAVFEDVGRHNALDKLLGFLRLNEHDLKAGFVLITSRASYELVRKCAKLDIALLASISAPTALAITLAERAGMGLASFCRGDGFVVYHSVVSQP